jgi:hypothetical protein
MCRWCQHTWNRLQQLQNSEVSQWDTSSGTSLSPEHTNANIHINTQLMCTAWSRKHPLKLLKPYGKEMPHSHIPLIQPNYSGTNQESHHSASQVFSHLIYICSESICAPAGTLAYSSLQLPTLNITPKHIWACNSVPEINSFPHTYLWQVKGRTSALNCTLLGWQFLMSTNNVSIFPMHAVWDFLTNLKSRIFMIFGSSTWLLFYFLKNWNINYFREKFMHKKLKLLLMKSASSDVIEKKRKDRRSLLHSTMKEWTAAGDTWAPAKFLANRIAVEALSGEKRETDVRSACELSSRAI